MWKKKKKDRFQQNPSPSPQIPLVPPEPVTGNFDLMEAKIRGEEIMMKEDLKQAKNAAELKKGLDKSEVDRRLEELRRQLGLKK